MEVYMRMKVEGAPLISGGEWGSFKPPVALPHEKSPRYPLRGPLWRREE